MVFMVFLLGNRFIQLGAFPLELEYGLGTLYPDDGGGGGGVVALI
jgi:hypothetical protein